LFYKPLEKQVVLTNPEREFRKKYGAAGTSRREMSRARGRDGTEEL
jgi:hypothetical protein